MCNCNGRIETIVEELPELLGVSTEGAFRGALQETLSTAFTEKFNDQLAGALCEIDLKPVVKDLPGGSMLTKFM